MASIDPRIRIRFESFDTKEIWFLIESQKLKTIIDLKNELLSNMSIDFQIDVYLDNGLITDWQSIKILRDNDLITIKPKTIDKSSPESQKSFQEFPLIESNTSSQMSSNSGSVGDIKLSSRKAYDSNEFRQIETNGIQSVVQNGVKKGIDPKLEASVCLTKISSNDISRHSSKRSDDSTEHKIKRMRRQPNRLIDFV